MPYQGRFFPTNPEKYVGNPNNICYRSGWERTFMEYCDKRPHVLRWASEEVIIPYFFRGDGKWHRYFVDMWLQVRNRAGNIETWLVEIKPHAQTQIPKPHGTRKRQLREALTYAKNQAKWEAATNFCNAKGWRFVILTEKDLYPNG